LRVYCSMEQGFQKLKDWFTAKDWQVYDFQKECWEAMHQGRHGLLNAPTGSGKTYALWLGCLLPYLNGDRKYRKGLKVIWITPLRALAGDIQLAMQEACRCLELPWDIAVRTGDTSQKEKQQQKSHKPDVLITTPETLHLLLSQKQAYKWFEHLEFFIVDEWHELLGSKRGVQVELALSRIRRIAQPPAYLPSLPGRMQVWGISATIGNMEEAGQVLMGHDPDAAFVHIRSTLAKNIEIESILPDEVEKYPWAGHLGIKMLDKILPIVQASRSTLMFTNTRSQTEIWYQQLMEKAPQLAGLVAMHHGSLDNSIRAWVEEKLHAGKLKLVVCTSSLDLGVDFRPVETVIQVGGPKGVARFIQRAGRSGHRPGVPSKIYFLPTHSLELVEAAALREAVKSGEVEARMPLQNCYDTLMQYLLTLAVGDGFLPNIVFEELKSTYAFQDLSTEDWAQLLAFLVSGGESLSSYEEYSKLEMDEQGVFRMPNRKHAMRHRLSIGTIVGDPSLKIKYISGGYIGSVEESFIALIKPGDVFWFAGRALEFVQVRDMTVLVRRSKAKKGAVPRWMGGRMPLTSLLSSAIRKKLDDASQGVFEDIEMLTIQPLLERQQSLSAIPEEGVLLIEKLQSKEGFHVFIYPFEGRLIHEVLASIVAYRISQSEPISFSIAMNDYGFELLSDRPFAIEAYIADGLFDAKDMEQDLLHTINQGDMAKRKFRDIASIAGLIFRGFPGKGISFKHLQASSGILYDVFETYDPNNLLLMQAKREVLQNQIDRTRFYAALHRISTQKICIKNTLKPSPLAFPIMVDRLREKLSSESIEDRVMKLQAQLENTK